MISVGLVNIGNEPVLRYMPDNKPVLDLSLAYEYGRKGQDGKRPTQWVSASMFGDRAERLTPYLKKGDQIMVTLEDIHIEVFTKKDGTQGSSVKARIANVELVRKQKQEREEERKSEVTFDDLKDDIPF